MNLGVMGKTTFKTPQLSQQQLDGKTWLEMASHFDHITIVALSTSLQYQRGATGNVTVLLLPRFPGPLGPIMYWLGATIVGVALTYSRGIKVWSLSEPVSGLVAFPLKLFTRAKIMAQLQGELFSLPADSYSLLKSRVVATAARLVCAVSDRVRAVSHRVRDQAIAAGVSPKKVIVVPSRTDSRVFDPARYLSDRNDHRERLGVRRGDSLIVFVGRLVATKGVTYLLQAISALASTRQDFRVLVVGGGPLHDSLEVEAAELGLAQIVTFYGAVPYSEVPRMLSVGDVFVAPSLDEGMPRAVLEALSMELPVVVTNVGGNAEILSGAECGFVVSPRDVCGLIEALDALLGDPERAKRMGSLGRQLIHERYDFENQIRALAEAHHELVSAPSRSTV